MSTAQGSSVLNTSLGKSLTGLSSWFHNVTGPQVSQSLRKDASTRRHLKSGKRGKSETWDYLRLDFFFQRFNVILFSVYKSQNGPTAQCEKTPPEISEGLGGQAGSWAQKYKSLFQNLEKIVLNGNEGNKKTSVLVSPVEGLLHAKHCCMLGAQE